MANRKTASEDGATLRARMAAAYAQVAPRYAQVNAAMPPALQRAAEQFLAELNASAREPHPRILDLGCGAGRDLAWLEAHEANGIGLDLSRSMLEQARRVTAAALVQGDMSRLPFADGCFRGVWCSAALLHLPKAMAPAALAEFRRVLQPGGLCFIAVKHGTGEGWEAESYGLPAPRFFACYLPEELARLLTDAGFVPGLQGVQVIGKLWLHTLTSSGVAQVPPNPPSGI